MNWKNKCVIAIICIVIHFSLFSCSEISDIHIHESQVENQEVDSQYTTNSENTTTEVPPLADKGDDLDFERQNENENATDNNSTDSNSTANVNETLIATDPNLIAFYLYPKQENNSYFEELEFGNRESIEKSSYSPSKTTVFLVHGFISNSTHKFTQSIKNAYLQNGIGAKENIIAVDWGKLSTPENYKDDRPPTPQWKDPSNDVFYQAAVRNVPVAGKRMAEFILFLVSEKFLPSPSCVHLIGFSLGAHVSGVCGYVVKQQNNTNNKSSNDIPPSSMIQRISGMDPAGPLYQNEMAVEKRLDPSHATFVDVVHTNSGQDGYYGAIGHADFHPNGGGPNQPGCQNSNVGNSIPESMTGTCAHNRAWQFYIRSITENLQACKCVGNGNVDFVLCRSMCTQKATFGRNCPSTARGNYYLEM